MESEASPRGVCAQALTDAAPVICAGRQTLRRNAAYFLVEET
jgi:hypothetical protein